jgi:hypothetical protein
MQGKLTFANTVEQFDAGNCDGGVVEVLEAEHGPGSGLDTPMILFDQIVQVFRRSQLGAPPCLVFVWNFTHCSMRSGIAIKRDADRCAQLRAKRFAEKGLGRCYIPLRTQSEVDGVAIPVDGAIQVDPTATDLQIRLVNTPRATALACIAIPALLELRNISLYPAHDRGMRNIQPTFGHHLN